MEKRIPVVVIRQIRETDTILRALQEYGIRCAEITFRTPCAEEALIYACKNYPQMLIGAGTVINGDQCRRALAAGAKFIVSPGFSEEAAAISRLKRRYSSANNAYGPAKLFYRASLRVSSLTILNIIVNPKAPMTGCLLYW